eukprot:g4944.t1
MSSFLPSPSFAGARPGYAFKSGEHGVGYYLDGGRGAGSGKRPRDDTPSGPLAKRARPADASARAAELLAEAERAAEASGSLAPALLDETSLKRALLALERSINENRKLRVTHAGKPEKFMESELLLDNRIRALGAVAATPRLYPVLAQLGTATSLLELLTHENADVAVDTVALLHDLTDADVLNAKPESTSAFMQSLLDAQFMQVLVSNLGRLNEGLEIDTSTDEGLLARKACETEARAVHNTLGIFENLLDVRPDLAGELCGPKNSSGGLLAWLLHRINVKGFDANKLYASEILSILMQFPSPRAKLVSSDLLQKSADKGASKPPLQDGVDALLHAVHYYRKRNPSDASEEECVENIFSSLSSALAEPEARRLFRKNQGVSLMLRIMKNKTFSYRGALRVLSHAVADTPETCAALVDAGGLKVLFPAFMGLGKLTVMGTKKKNKTVNAIGNEEETLVVGLVANLVVQLSIRKDRVSLDSGKNGVSSDTTPFEYLIPLKRVMRKFRDHNFEKADRLVELHEKYFSRVVAAERSHLSSRRHLADVDEDEDSALLDMRRQDAGLDALQAVALTLSSLCSLSPALRQYIVEKLEEQEDENAATQVIQVLEELAEDEAEAEDGDAAGGRAHGLFRAMKICVEGVPADHESK